MPPVTVPRPSMITLAGEPLPLLDPTRIYVCGITPYAVTHLGHAATFVWTDVLTRVLRDAGVTPILARNITDVDDVLTAAAARAGAHADRFAYLQQYDFDRDMNSLRVRRPDHEPRARHYIDAVINIAALLLETGAAYESAGGVYFPGKQVAINSGLDDETAMALATEYGGRVDDPAKRHPLDAAVWQPSASGEPSWPSPWGPGRPGWHAECSAMTLAIFGPALDIHGGGADLEFPHHAFEAAIAEAVTGVAPMARRWMRVGIVGVKGAKMAKSTGNLVLVDDLLVDHPAPVIRLMLLDRPWHQAWDFTADLLDAAASRLDALQSIAGQATNDAAADSAAIESARGRLRTDLDVAGAIEDLLAGRDAAAAAWLLDTLRLR